MTDFEKSIKRNVDKTLFEKIRDHKYGKRDREKVLAALIHMPVVGKVYEIDNSDFGMIW